MRAAMTKARARKVLSPAVASARRTLAKEQAGLAALSEAMTGPLGEAFSEAVSRIAAAKGRVIVTGMGKSGHVGRKIAATLASTGTPSHFVHPGEASHGDLGMIMRDDVILALSWSGETNELADIIGYARRRRVTLAGVTSKAGSALGKQADIALVLPRAEEACPNGLAPTTSTTMQLALGDALAVALLEARGFSADDFRVFHPGGRLGAQLKRVSDIMHTGERLPLVSAGAPMREAIAEMSAKGFGCVMVVDAKGKLAGIITDGDIRRNFREGLSAEKVEAVMTKNPKHVTPDTLLMQALEIQESRKITALIVTEKGKPAGLVHYLDLLRSGVA